MTDMNAPKLAKKLKTKALELDRDTTLHTLADLLREAADKIIELDLDCIELRTALADREESDS